VAPPAKVAAPLNRCPEGCVAERGPERDGGAASESNGAVCRVRRRTKDVRSHSVCLHGASIDAVPTLPVADKTLSFIHSNLLFAGEAKKLPRRSHANEGRDVFCTLSLDQEEIYRTSTIPNSLKYDNFCFVFIPRNISALTS